MSRCSVYTLLILAATGTAFGQRVFDPFEQAPPPSEGVTDGALEPVAEAPQGEYFDQRVPLGFTWWNDGPAMVREGNAAYKEENFPEAELWYQDADFATEGHPAVDYNLGLALAGQKKWAESAAAFSSAIAQSGEDVDLRTDSLFNRGTARLRQAREMQIGIMSRQQSPGMKRAEREKLEAERQQAIGVALEAIDNLTTALDRNPAWKQAQFNRAQAQHILNKLTNDPPPEQQQQQQQDQQERGEGDPQQQEQEGGEEQNEQEGEDEQQQQGEQEQQQPGGNPQSQEQQSEGEESSSQSSGGAEQQGVQMTPGEATALLQMLGEEEQIRLRKRSAVGKVRPEKDW